MNARRSVSILSFTLLVVSLGYGIVLPVMPFLIEHFGAGGRELGWMMATYSFMQMICAPLWGILSDRIGRKPVLALGVLGYALSLFMFGVATRFWVLFVARSLSGILSSATMAAAMAYVGDSAAKEDRSGGMGRLGAAMGVGTVVGPLAGGWLSANSLSLPFLIGSGIAFVALLLVLVLLPESLAPRAAGGGRTLPTRAALFTTLVGPAGVLLLLVCLLGFGMANVQGVTGLYVVDKFSFNTKQVGTVWMVMGGVTILVQGLLTGPLTKRLGEVPLIYAGLAGGALGFLGMSLAVDYVTTLLALGFFTLSLALMGPALNAYLSTFAGEHQGTVMGLNSAATSLGRVVGPLWAGYLYEVNLEYPYFSGAGALILGLAVCAWGMRQRRQKRPVDIP